MDTGYGTNTALRDGITALAGTTWPAFCRTPQRGQRANAASSQSVLGPWLATDAPVPQRAASPGSKRLVLSLAAKAWRPIKWREGSADWLVSRFARLRVQPAHRDSNRTAATAGEWLLIGWPEGEQASTRYWLSTLPQDMTLARLVPVRQAALAHRGTIVRSPNKRLVSVISSDAAGLCGAMSASAAKARAPEGPAGGTGFTTFASLTDDSVMI